MRRVSGAEIVVQRSSVSSAEPEPIDWVGSRKVMSLSEISDKRTGQQDFHLP